MKKILHSFIFLFVPVFLCAQSVSPEVISSSGDYFEGSNASLSWTLGEIATETLSNGSVTLTQGFQQPFSVFLRIDLDVFLEGPYQSGTMDMDLKNEGIIPLSQPYNVSPWNYPGTESVGSIPANVVDWVLVDLRDATSAGTATASTSVEQKAAFVLSDGTVVDTDGTSALEFSTLVSNDPYVVIWHRNHLGILSADPLSYSGGVYAYDFTTDISKAHGGSAGYKMIETGVYGMAGGDADKDGDIDNDDKVLWTSSAGTFGYQPEDFNMDTEVNNPDKNDVLIENGSISSQVPD